MAKKKDTTKILLHNLTTNEIVLCGNKQVIADMFNTSWNNIVNWFREDKIVRKDYNGCSYMLYKPDYYLYISK
jgi:hypothetical protein